jgi:hypothetical protein
MFKQLFKPWKAGPFLTTKELNEVVVAKKQESFAADASWRVEISDEEGDDDYLDDEDAN